MEDRMLSTMEVFHYVKTFQNELFALIAQDDRQLLELLTDLDVIHSSGIKIIVCCRHREGLPELIERLNGFGHEFHYHACTEKDLKKKSITKQLRKSLDDQALPILALGGFEGRDEGFGEFHREVVSFVAMFGASKLFFAGKHAMLELGNRSCSYSASPEVKLALDGKLDINIGRKNLEFLYQVQQEHGVDLVILKAARGELFREIFTHAGAGTLISQRYQNEFRQAVEGDVKSIFFLMRPYLQRGIILPVTADELKADIGSYYVFAVNGQIVACATAVDHGEAIELGKLCALPRYQGGGRARELVNGIIEMARHQTREYVFALTVKEETGAFFCSLGFQPAERRELPESWKQRYDFSRPSQAYQLFL